MAQHTGQHIFSQALLRAGKMDEALQAAHHYRYCRTLAQLGPVVPVPVSGGWAMYEAEQLRRGMKAGDIKPTQLDPGLFWQRVYEAGAPEKAS